MNVVNKPKVEMLPKGKISTGNKLQTIGILRDREGQKQGDWRNSSEYTEGHSDGSLVTDLFKMFLWHLFIMENINPISHSKPGGCGFFFCFLNLPLGKHRNDCLKQHLWALCESTKTLLIKICRSFSDLAILWVCQALHLAKLVKKI